MKEILFDNPLFGILISFVTFGLGRWLFAKTKFVLFSPFLVAAVLTIGVIVVFDIPLEYYNRGGDIIQFFLPLATVCLALPLFHQLPLLRKYWLPVIVGTTVGSIVAIGSVVFFGKLLGIDDELLKSFVPKSITTPLGLELSNMIGGIPAITVFAISVAGVTGNVLGPLILKLFRVKHPVAKGIGMGVSSHVFGTTKALEMGEQEGAMGAISLVIAGIITIFIAPIFISLFLG